MPEPEPELTRNTKEYSFRYECIRAKVVAVCFMSSSLNFINFPFPTDEIMISCSLSIYSATRHISHFPKVSYWYNFKISKFVLK